MDIFIQKHCFLLSSYLMCPTSDSILFLNWPFFSILAWTARQFLYPILIEIFWRVISISQIPLDNCTGLNFFFVNLVMCLAQQNFCFWYFMWKIIIIIQQICWISHLTLLTDPRNWGKWCDWLSELFQWHVNLSWIILYLEVKELYSVYVPIYIFLKFLYMLICYKVFLSNTNNFQTDLFYLLMGP